MLGVQELLFHITFGRIILGIVHKNCKSKSHEKSLSSQVQVQCSACGGTFSVRFGQRSF